MHLQTITLTFAKGILLLRRGADDQLPWHLVVWINKRRLLFRIYSTRLLQKVVDFTLDFEEADQCSAEISGFGISGVMKKFHDWPMMTL